MKLLNFKTQEELNKTAWIRLKNIGLNDVGAGGVTRLLVSVYNDIMGTFYKTLKLNHANAFLSSAENEFLDYIGSMLNCKRKNNEQDDDYRYRISQQTLALASANESAIRLTALSIKGVQNITLKPYSHGTGSFTMFVITETAKDKDNIIEQVKNAISEIVAYGTQFSVESPELLEVEIGVKLFFNTIAKESEKQEALTKAKEALQKYINSRAIGEPLIINEITERVMKVHENVLNYQLHKLRINRRDVMKVDHTLRWNQRFIESSKPEAITTF